MRTRLLAISAATTMLCTVSVAATAAPPVEREHYSFTDVFTETECGFAVDFVVEGGGLLMVREVRGSDGQAFLALDNYEFRAVLTNADTGAFMVVRGNGLFKETSGTHVEGNIWEFTAMDVGQPLVVEDSDGNVVLRDRGRVTFRALFDTLGDSQPGGILLEEEITGVNGPHPSLDADFCEVVTDLIG
ncbi:MAG TPA: hypothetical protein VFQ15_04440 [Jiangellaceae bacterium]|nr:hypothetical protein [Jiangellaceae bacterium]